MGDACIICMEALGADVHTLPCGHTFHTHCIVAWAQSPSEGHSTCPVCRSVESDTDLPQVNTMPQAAWDAAAYRKLERFLTTHSDVLEPDERKRLCKAVAGVAKAAAKAKEVRRELLSVRKANKDTLARHSKLQRRRWDTQRKLYNSRRLVLSMFPVTHVVVRTDEPRAGSAAVAVRRSRRAAGMEPEDLWDDA